MRIRQSIMGMAGLVLIVGLGLSTPAQATSVAYSGVTAVAPTHIVQAVGPSVVATYRGASGLVRPEASTIVCTPNVQNPHNSSHVHGTVNVVVTLACTSAVTKIGIRAALYRNGLLVKDSHEKDFFGARFAQNNAAEPCHNATYQGWMSYIVVFPPGYVPPTGSSSGFGNAVRITC
jgi:hypothetical protein